jgi:hypothetical protein
MNGVQLKTFGKMISARKIHEKMKLKQVVFLVKIFHLKYFHTTFTYSPEGSFVNEFSRLKKVGAYGKNWRLATIVA